MESEVLKKKKKKKTVSHCRFKASSDFLVNEGFFSPSKRGKIHCGRIRGRRGGVATELQQRGR